MDSIIEYLLYIVYYTIQNYRKDHGRVGSKLLFFFVAYLLEFAAVPKNFFFSINSWYKECCSMSDQHYAIFLSL